MNKTEKNVVVVLAKRPQLGNIKTRIAKDTSMAFAQELAVASIDDLINNIGDSNYFDLAVATDTLADLQWFEKNFKVSGFVINKYTKKIIKEEKGQKINNAFQALFNDYGYEKAILIPMDMPFVQVEDIISSFTRLNDHNYVLGPETNGGIYLIGMAKKYYQGKLFVDVKWSTAESFDSLVNNFQRDKSYILKLRDDINTFQDILINKEIIKLHCPKLYNLLLKNGYYISDKERYIDFDDLNISLPVVSVIIERTHKNVKQVLLQTRYKPSLDPDYSGLLEIPSGVVERYEDLKKAAIREVKEETGLDVEIKHDNKQIARYSNKVNLVELQQPDCIAQQTRGGRSYIAFGFISNVKEGSGKATANIYETRNPQWVSLTKLKELIKNKKDKFFPLIVPIIQKYLKEKKNEQ